MDNMNHEELNDQLLVRREKLHNYVSKESIRSVNDLNVQMQQMTY